MNYLIYLGLSAAGSFLALMLFGFLLYCVEAVLNEEE